MPNNNTKISDMSPAEELNTTDLLMISQQDAEVETEFHTKNTTIGDLADEVVTGIQFTNDLNTDDKTIVGAINEAAAVGKVSEYYHKAVLTPNSYDSWVNSGTAVDGHTVYQSSSNTYEKTSGDDLATWVISGYEDVTFYIKQDGSDTSKAYTVLGKPNTSIDLSDSSSYTASYKNQVLSDYTSYKFENLAGATKTFQILYHTDPNDPSGTATVDLNNGQFVDTGTTVDGHTVYKSDAGSYGVAYGTSKCRISIEGVTSFKIYYKTSTSGSNRIYIGELDTPVSTSDYDTRSGGEYDYDYTYFHCSSDSHYLEIMYNKGSSTDSAEDRVYFYIVLDGALHTTRGYIYAVPGQIHETSYRGEIFNNYEYNFAVGEYSHAEGNSTLAGGDYSHAEGRETQAVGYAAHAEGYQTQATNSYAHAEGSNCKAVNSYAHAEGYSTTAAGSNSHAEGNNTNATDYCTHAEGCNTLASNTYAHAEGYETKAAGWASHAEGYKTQALSSYTHAEGKNNKATNDGAHAEGLDNIASDWASHAEGRYTTASGLYSHAEGESTVSSQESSHAEGFSTIASGYKSHAEGGNTTASSEGAHAEGCYTQASGSNGAHSEGNYTQAIGTSSHAEGYYTKAYGSYSHAEGNSTSAGSETSTYQASDSAHAEGLRTQAINWGAHAEGTDSLAQHIGAHAEGRYSIASGEGSHAEGCYTEASGACAHVEGNGYNSSTKNIASGSGSHAEGYATRATGNNSHAEGGGWGGQYNIASGTASHAEGGGNNAIGPCSHVEGTRNTVYSDSGHADGSGNTVYGHEAHGEGAGTITAGEQGHTEGAGNTNVADKGHIEGGGNRNTYNASLSHTEGAGNTNYGIQAHVEGSGNTLSGEESHVEGAGNRVHGPKSHGEGGGNVTYGLGSHIEGKHNVAVGYGQHAEGINNVIGVTEEPDYFSYGTTYAVDDIVAVNDLYRDNYPYSGALEPTTPFLFKCITAPGQIQETTGVQIVTASEWSSSTTYQAGSVVKVSGVGLYTNPSENTGKHPAIKSNGWNRISAILSPFSSHTPSSKTYYLLDCDDGIHSSKVAIVDANTTVAAMWEPVTTPIGSHIEGLGNISTGDHQHVQGKFNTPDAQKAFIIGNGSVTEGVITRSNAMTVDWSGNMTLAGDVTVGAIGDTISGLATRIPAAPTTDGTYVLTVTVSSGVPTYSWVASN